jgi:hypothetical protein
MRGQDDVIHAEQFRGHARLLPIHVQSCPCNALLFERGDKGCLVDDGTTCNVDEVAVRPQRIENARANQTASGSRRRTGNDQASWVMRPHEVAIVRAQRVALCVGVNALTMT